MKKILPCSLTTKLSLLLLFFVSLLGTSNLSAQCNAEAFPRFVCAGEDNNILYSTASVLLDNGTTLTWTIVGDSTGGATFVNNGSTVSTTTLSSGLFNSVVVHLGPLSGSTEVRMSIPGDPPGTGCAASVFTKLLVVQGSATAVLCPNDLTTVSITPGLTGTKIGTSQTISQFPGACGQYTYELVTSPGGVVVATNNTGVFPNVIPQNYVIRIRDCDNQCSATSPVINSAPVAPNPLNLICPTAVDRPACASQAELENIFQGWLASVSHTGGFDPVTTIVTPPGDLHAPSHCGGTITVTWTASDRCLQTDTCSSTFTVQPSLAPVIVCAPGGELGCNPTIPGPTAPSITSACPTLPYTSNDVITGTDCALTLTRTYTVTNECNQTSTCAQVFTYKVDTTDPVLVGLPTGGDLGCNPANLPACQSVTATDNCPGAITVTCSGGTITSDGCGRRQVFTYTAIDACLNDVSRDVVYTWKEDTTLPVITCVANKEVACDTAVVFDTPSATDNCTATANIVIIPGAVVVVDNGDGTFSHTKSWTARDECNNTSIACSQTVKVLSCAQPNGCTLGYWKNHTLAWDCYTTCTLYNSVFTGSTMPASLTLLQALNLGGNTGCENLARQSVAALLNICDGTLDYTVADIPALQALVNAAFANGTCNAAGSLLDRYNNEGGANHCDVEKSKNTSQSTCTTRKGVNATGNVAPSSTFTVYPNPFTNTFSVRSINLDSPINMSIYDVLGRSVETRTITPDEFNSPLFGRDYSTGMYNIILNQATEQRTLRIIKE